MSLPDEEARALSATWAFLCDLSSGVEKRIPRTTRERARQVARHFPLAAEERWLATFSPSPEALRAGGKALFSANMESLGVDPVIANAEWLIDDKLRKFWIDQAMVVAKAMGGAQ